MGLLLREARSVKSDRDLCRSRFVRRVAQHDGARAARGPRGGFPVYGLSALVERYQFLFDQKDVWLEPLFDFGEAMIRDYEESRLLEYAGFARRLDDAPDVFVHALRHRDCFGRARPFLVMNAVERYEMNQHQVRLVIFDDELGDLCAPPVGGGVAARRPSQARL